MTVWVRGFVIPQIADVHLAFEATIRKAEQLASTARRGPLSGPAAAMLAELRRSYVGFNDSLQVIADQAAIEATRGIQARLKRTQVRPDTRTAPHLRDVIFCAPITGGLSVATGMVGIGRVSTLDRAINANTPGYGPYWRAQEYGTGGVVPSQIGRVLFGYFSGPGGGNLTAPDPQYAGGGGPHPIFLPTGRKGRGSAGDVLAFMQRVDAMPSHMAGALARGGERGPGFGTIGHEIQPRQFIGLGADGAAVHWRNQIAALQQRTIDEIAAITAP